MLLVDLQLEQAYGKKDLTILENKEFQFHWPFDIFRPIKYVATLNLMRLFCYLPIPVTLTMYGLRAIFEQSRGFSEIYGFLFQVVHFAIASLWDMAVYSFSQGVK